jgi:hypothetical protein
VLLSLERHCYGMAKTHLQHVATAAAINVDRMVAWLEERPRAMPRTSRFAALVPVHDLPSAPHPSEQFTHSSPRFFRLVQAVYFYFILQKLLRSYPKKKSSPARCSTLIRGVDQQYQPVCSTGP